MARHPAADQRHHLPGWTNTSLDKAWWRMQELFSSEGMLVRRPGYDLVAGDVTYPEGYEQGYLPHIAVLSALLLTGDELSITDQARSGPSVLI